MKPILRIFDCSQYISAGSPNAFVSRGVIEGSSSYRANEMPCGGIALLLKAIEMFRDGNTELVFCFDRPPQTKRKLHEESFPGLGGYKGTRPKKDASVKLQRDMAEEVLKHIGVNVIYADDYEADDCIYSLCRKYKKDFAHIYVHNRDSDLFFLVEDGISMTRVNRQGKDINMSNYEYTVSSKFTMPYNTVLLNKLFDGDSGDNIPKVSNAIEDKITEFIPESAFKYLGNCNIFRKLVGMATDYDKRTMNIVDMLIPRTVPDELLYIDEVDFDTNVFDYYAYHLYDARKYAGSKSKEDPLAEEIIRRYLDLYNGGDYL